MRRADHWPTNNVATSEHARLRPNRHGSEQVTRKKTNTRAGSHSHTSRLLQFHDRSFLREVTNNVRNTGHICKKKTLIERIPRRTQTTGQHLDRMSIASCRVLHNHRQPDCSSIVPRLASIDRLTEPNHRQPECSKHRAVHCILIDKIKSSITRTRPSFVPVSRPHLLATWIIHCAAG